MSHTLDCILQRQRVSVRCAVAVVRGEVVVQQLGHIGQLDLSNLCVLVVFGQRALVLYEVGRYVANVLVAVVGS